MKRCLVGLCIILQFGLSSPKMLADKTTMKDMAVSMWARSEMRSNSVSILDVGCGNGSFMPKAVKYFEGRLGIEVDTIMGIDIGLTATGRLDGSAIVTSWNKRLKEKFGDRYSIQWMNILNIRNLGHKFNYVFYITPYPAYNTGKRVLQVMKVMKDDGVLSITPHLGEHDEVEASLLAAGVQFIEIHTIIAESEYPIDDISFIVKRSEIRDAETTKVFAAIMVERILRTSA